MATCFVVMGFGKKTDFETGRTLDLDKTYKNIIKPAVVAAGLECTRADEIQHGGVIDVPMYERLLAADVVVADLSTSNKNAFYELGVRHALRPHTTIVICEDGAKSFPFDVNHVAIRQYHHMGDGIDFDEVERFRSALTAAIKDITSANPPKADSPVYTFLRDLTPPGRAALEDVASEIAKSFPVMASAAQAGSVMYGEIMQEVEEAEQKEDFQTAKVLLSALRRTMKTGAEAVAAAARAAGQPDVHQSFEDPYIIQRLALATYKSKHPTRMSALEEARVLLATLNPETSNDPETLGLWSAVHKRMWESVRELPHLDAAIRASQRGFYLRKDHYNGINLAYLLNERAAESLSAATHAATEAEVASLRADAVAAFVEARNVRREVLQICHGVIRRGGISSGDRYWVLATIAEAYVGIGDEDAARRALEEAAGEVPTGGGRDLRYPINYGKPPAWMLESTESQMANLRRLLKESPMRFISTNPTSPQ